MATDISLLDPHTVVATTWLAGEDTGGVGGKFQVQAVADLLGVALDIDNNGSNDSDSIAKIVTTGDTYDVFSESVADQLTINAGNKWPVAHTVDISAQTAVTSATASADYLIFYSASLGATRKILFEDIPYDESVIDHDQLLNYVAAEHVSHSTVSITTTAGTSGLTGGGTIASTRSLSVDIDGTTEDTNPDGAADYLLTFDDSSSALKKVLLDNLPARAIDVAEAGVTVVANGTRLDFGTGFDVANGGSGEVDITLDASELDHNSLQNYSSDRHTDHTAVSILTATGLTGGGDISATRTINYDINALTADASPAGASDYVVTYDATDGSHKKVLLNNLPGGGGGTNVALDLGDDDVDESSALNEIATTGDTNSIFTEPSADKLLVNCGNNWPQADDVDINSLTEDAAISGSADFLIYHDTAAGARKKIKPDDLPSGAAAATVLTWIGV